MFGMFLNGIIVIVCIVCSSVMISTGTIQVDWMQFVIFIILAIYGCFHFSIYFRRHFVDKFRN